MAMLPIKWQQPLSTSLLLAAALAVLTSTACSASSSLASSTSASSSPTTASASPTTRSTPETAATSASTTAPVGPATHITGTDINACSLVTPAKISALVGFTVDTATPKTKATGQDQCTYSNSLGSSLTVTIYQAGSVVNWTILTNDSGATTPVGGVGDKAATDGAIALDVQAGSRLIAVSSGSDTGRVAVAKAFVSALH